MDGSDEAGVVMYVGSELMAGKVPRRGRRELALARSGKRACCEGMQGLGPQLEAGEKNGEFGLRRSPEKLETMVLSEYDVITDVAL